MSGCSRFCIVLVTAFGATLDAASATILADKVDALCKKEGNGLEILDRDALAFEIVIEAGAQSFIDGSNRDGTTDGQLQLRSTKDELSEPAYMVYHAGMDGSNKTHRPFGPDRPLEKADGTLAADNAILRITSDELADVVNLREAEHGSKILRIQRRPDAVPTPNDEEYTNPRSIFRLDPPLIITCEPKPTQEERVTSAKSNATDVLSAFRLRGDVKDLHVSRSQESAFRASKPAQFSFVSDEENNQDTISLNAVVGWELLDDADGLGLLPFVSFESQNVDTNNSNDSGGSGDIMKLSPGLLFSHSIQGPVFLRSRLETSWIADLEQESDQAKLRFYLDPAFPLANREARQAGEPRAGMSEELGPGVLFGSELAPVGPFVFRPDITFIGDISWVFDEGESEELQSADEYLGIGGEAGLGLRLDTVGVLSAFALKSGVRELRLFGDIDAASARRWFASIVYQPPELPSFGVTLDYVNGENSDTLQNEESVKLGLSLKF